MTQRADPGFLLELQKYGPVSIESCFNCGNCSAVCPLSTEEENFPRRMIRYAQIGMRDKLVRSKELLVVLLLRGMHDHVPAPGRPG